MLPQPPVSDRSRLAPSSITTMSASGAGPEASTSTKRSTGVVNPAGHREADHRRRQRPARARHERLRGQFVVSVREASCHVVARGVAEQRHRRETGPRRRRVHRPRATPGPPARRRPRPPQDRRGRLRNRSSRTGPAPPPSAIVSRSGSGRPPAASTSTNASTGDGATVTAMSATVSASPAVPPPSFSGYGVATTRYVPVDSVAATENGASLAVACAEDAPLSVNTTLLTGAPLVRARSSTVSPA